MNGLERSLALNCYVLKTSGTQFCRRKKLFWHRELHYISIYENSRTSSYF